MITFWKQLGAWVTGLGDDAAKLTRLKMTFAFGISFFVALALLSLLLHTVYISNTERAIFAIVQANENPNLIIGRFTKALDRQILIIQFLVTGGATLIGYFVSGSVIGPLKRTIESQKKFIANASHELRTPLSIMKTNSEVTLLDVDNFSVKEAAEALKSNIEEVDRMSSIIGNLLSLSSTDKKSRNVPIEKVDLTRVMTRLVDQFQSTAGKKDISLTIIHSDTGRVWANETAIEEMVINLLTNAINYTPRGGKVEVGTLRKGYSHIEFMIQDNGIGISQKDLPFIFNPFFKGKKSIDGGLNTESFGLGLAMVKGIAEKYSGTIKVKSRVNLGTQVSVNFLSAA